VIAGTVLCGPVPSARADDAGKSGTPAGTATASAPAAQGLVPVRLLAYATDDAYRVTLGSATCTTPCALSVPPGVAALHAEGAGAVDGRLLIPPVPGVVRVRHHDVASQIAGVVLVPFGVMIASTGWLAGETCSGGSPSYDTCRTAHRITWPVVGLATLATGIVLLVRGRGAPPDANRVLLTGQLTSPPVQVTTLGVGPLARGAWAGAGLAF